MQVYIIICVYNFLSQFFLESDDFFIFNPVVGLAKESAVKDLIIEVTLDEFGKETDSSVESFALQLLHDANILPPNFVLGTTVISMIDVGESLYNNKLY